MKATVRRIVKSDPDLSPWAMAARLGISHVTARKYMKLAGVTRDFRKVRDASEA